MARDALGALAVVEALADPAAQVDSMELAAPVDLVAEAFMEVAVADSTVVVFTEAAVEGTTAGAAATAEAATAAGDGKRAATVLDLERNQIRSSVYNLKKSRNRLVCARLTGISVFLRSSMRSS